MKNATSWGVAVALSLAAMVVGTVSAQADLVAHYTFDDGNANDFSGNNNHGTLGGTATFEVDPVRGGVLSLDGMGKVDLGNPDSLNITGEITVAAWVNIGPTTIANANIVNRGHGGSPNREFTFRIGSTGTEYDFGSWETGRGDNHATLPLPPEDIGMGNWVHVAGTAAFDGSMYMWNLYRNGELVNTSVPYPDGMLDMTVGWAIGARGGVAGVERGFNGLIDDVRIYNNALAAEQIADIMMPGMAADPGDFNNDGVVDNLDYDILVNNLGGHLDGPVSRAQGDMNFDGKIDLTDFGLFKEIFPGALGQGQGVPEPSSAVLAALALVGLCGYPWIRRRRS